MSDIVTRYLACWNETDAVRRAELVTDLCSAHARYVDPLADVTGPGALEATIASVQRQFPGLQFTPVGAADAHHDVVRFAWGLGPAGEEPIVIGFDVVVTDESGRIASVVGFLDRVPS
jgi:hypothetical protein